MDGGLGWEAGEGGGSFVVFGGVGLCRDGEVLCSYILPSAGIIEAGK